MTLTADSRRFWALFSILMGCYLLIYVASPRSIDGEAILAVARGLIQRGSPEISILGAEEGLLPAMSRMGSFGLDGELYSKKGISPSILLVPLLSLGQSLPGLGLRATAMLFNPLITALTAAWLYRLGRALGAEQGPALALGLLYGLATFAISYVKSLFGEPLAALLLLIAVDALLRYQQDGRPIRAALAGLCYGLLCGINLGYVLMGPLLALYGFGLKPSGWNWRDLWAFAVPVLLLGISLMAFNMLRFGNPVESGYNFDEGEGFNYPILWGLYGLFLSPYRGLFWYTPLLLLAIPGAWVLRRVQSRLFWLIAALVATQALTYAGWWSWHGGIVWGPRFLIPVLPLLVLALLPLLNVAGRAPWISAALAGFTLISLPVQALGALYSYQPYIGYLYSNYGSGQVEGLVSGLADSVMTDLALSPILGHLALWRSGWPLEAAWLQSGVDVVYLLAALACVGLGIALLLWRRAWMLLLALLLIPLGMVAARPPAPEAVALAESLQASDTVVAATTRYGSALIDVKAPLRIVTMNAPTAPDDPLAAGLWAQALAQSERLAYQTWFPPADLENWPEQQLWQQAAFISQTSLQGDRLLYFDLRPAPALDSPSGWTFGPIALAAYGQRRDRDMLRLSLQWDLEGPTPAADMAWFVHLLDPSGQIHMQQDRAPQGGYTPVSGWMSGRTVIDHLAFPMDESQDLSGWQWRIGWVNPQDGTRLPTEDEQGRSVEAGFLLLPLPQQTD